jgi:Holliday junction resolvasome RuvABC DNA-binding subunit
VKGSGETIANRLVVELKGKLPAAAGTNDGAPSVNEEAVRAMVALGYERRPAEDAVRRALRDLGGQAAVEDVIRRSLNHV